MKKYFLTLLIPFFIGACKQSSTKTTIEKKYINPAYGYTQVVTTTANGVKTIYLSGQLGEGDDLASQMRSSLMHVKEQLAEAGANYADIVKMNSYIVNYQPDVHYQVFRSVRNEVMGNENMPASTLLGVQALAVKEALIEIDAIAVIPAN